MRACDLRSHELVFPRFPFASDERLPNSPMTQLSLLAPAHRSLLHFYCSLPFSQSILIATYDGNYEQ